MMALVVQKTGQRQGNPNARLYALASRNDIFHDIVVGNNSVPGLTGFSGGPGWDPVTGLGSVDAGNMVNNWGAGLNQAPVLQLSTNTISFGNEVVNTTSGNQVVTVKNAGNATVNITNLVIQRTKLRRLPSATTCPNPSGTLIAGASCTVTMTFKPTTTGARTASIAFHRQRRRQPANHIHLRHRNLGGAGAHHLGLRDVDPNRHRQWSLLHSVVDNDICRLVYFSLAALRRQRS